MKRDEEYQKAAFEYIESDAVRPENMQLAYGDFINGAKWADAHPDWHKVSEELPEPSNVPYSLHKQVLVARAGGNIAFPATYCKDGKWYIIEEHTVEIMPPDFWMPMPVIPEEVEDPTEQTLNQTF